MKIGVTGANGQLGCSLKKIARETPLHTFVFSDLPEIDITDKAGMTEWVKQNHIDILINCAAYTAVDKAEEDQEKARHINVEGPKTLGEICATEGCKLIHISTDYVFSGMAETPYTETEATNPVNFYGKTKLEGEEAIRKSGCDAFIIRTSWLFSEFGQNFVKTMLRLGKERDKISVVDDQIGCPTYAVDLAHAIIQLIENGFSGYNTYHYCNTGITTWYDFARMIFIINENPIQVAPIDTKDYPTPAKRPAYSVLDTTKIRQAGIEAPYWVDSLKACLKEIDQDA